MDNILLDLKANFARMCDTVEEMLIKANALIEKPDYREAKNIIHMDKIVDDAEMDIEHNCMKILLRHQPFAKDFRDISCILKAITDVERIGDQSADIAGIVIGLTGKVKIDKLEEMGNLALEMTKLSCESLINEDCSLALKTQALDDKMDNLFVLACEDLVAELKKSTQYAKDIAELLMIAKYYERIGDHAVNICEWAEFDNTGIHNKHQ